MTLFGRHHQLSAKLRGQLLETLRGHAHALFVNASEPAAAAAAAAAAAGKKEAAGGGPAQRPGATTEAYGSAAAAGRAAAHAAPLQVQRPFVAARACVCRSWFSVGATQWCTAVFPCCCTATISRVCVGRGVEETPPLPPAPLSSTSCVYVFFVAAPGARKAWPQGGHLHACRREPRAAAGQPRRRQSTRPRPCARPAHARSHTHRHKRARARARSIPQHAGMCTHAHLQARCAHTHPRASILLPLSQSPAAVVAAGGDRQVVRVSAAQVLHQGPPALARLLLRRTGAPAPQ